MKKTLLIAILAIGMLGLGAAQGFAAIPTIDGFYNPGTEWDNSNASSNPYPYYLEVTDPNEAGNIIDSMDISHVVFLQELDAFGGDATPDGMYLLIETFEAPRLTPITSGEYPGITGNQAPEIRMQGDFNADGISDVHLLHQLTLTGEIVEVCTMGPDCLFAGATWIDITTVGGTWARNDVIEYFFPTGTFGTPADTPFPFSFIGTITYDNGASDDGRGGSDDDLVIGTLIPEPGTMFLLGGGLLGLLGFRRFRSC